MTQVVPTITMVLTMFLPGAQYNETIHKERMGNPILGNISFYLISKLYHKFLLTYYYVLFVSFPNKHFSVVE